MSKQQHTPGPWQVDGNVIRGDAQGNGSVSVACILDVAYPYGRWAGESAKANARLIAAAPDLLESLQEVLPMLEQLLMIRGEPEPGSIGHKARAAIAEATGVGP